MLVAACAKTEPSPWPTPEKDAVTEPRANVELGPRVTNDEAPSDVTPRAPASAEAGTNGKRATPEGKDDDGHAAGKPHEKTGKRVTMGCACQVDDPLCSCL